jgi:hypothetical protein
MFYPLKYTLEPRRADSQLGGRLVAPHNIPHPLPPRPPPRYRRAAPTMPDCGSCGAPDAPSLCSACKFAAYCGPACQRAAWADHKAVCKAIQADVAAAPLGQDKKDAL